MNNTLWSTKVQSTELLYYSRLEKFNESNKDLWFDLLKVKKNLKVLEIGCGGGHFTNMIKQYFPSCDVTGIDLDENHIVFAKEKAKELKLDVKYLVADVADLPFGDEEFDLVFSHTVVEHVEFNDFIKEQKRVLKSGGDLVIMRVDMNKKVDRPFMFNEEKIGKVYDKMIFDQASSHSVAKYLEEPDLTMQRLNQYGFKNIDFKYNRVVYYMPDIEQDKQVALKQIERNYYCKLYNALFNLNRAQNGEEIKPELLGLLEGQYLKRVEMLNCGEKIFDFQSSNTITISATK